MGIMHSGGVHRLGMGDVFVFRSFSRWDSGIG